MYTPRPSKISHGRMSLLIIASVVLGLIAVTAVNSQRPLSSPSTQPQPSTSSESVVQKTVPMPSDIYGDEVASLEEAQNLANFQVLVPHTVPTGYGLARIGVKLVTLPQGQVAYLNFKYSDEGHEFIVWQQADGTVMPPVTDKLLEEWNRHKRVTINGCVGVGHEKDIQTVQGQTEWSPSSVMWWCDGVIRTVVSYDLSLSDLLSIAESIK